MTHGTNQALFLPRIYRRTHQGDADFDRNLVGFRCGSHASSFCLRESCPTETSRRWTGVQHYPRGTTEVRWMHSTRRTAKKRDIYCFVYYNSHIRVSIVVGVSVRVVSWSRRPAAPPVESDASSWSFNCCALNAKLDKQAGGGAQLWCDLTDR